MGHKLKPQSLYGDPTHAITGYAFWCPGCQEPHSFRLTPGGWGGHIWTFNGDMDRPTFSPSLLVHQSDKRPRCHLFMKDGRLEFLGDCEHGLAGKTVECPDWDDKPCLGSS